MTSKTIVITGASDGIGAAAARRLSRNGDKVVVVGRSESKTVAVAEELGADYFVADFADLSQVRALADKIRSEYPRIDVLANNAGGLVSKPQTTADGLEKTYQVNYLAPFLLTTELLDVLVESRASVVNTTSSSHKLLRRFSVDSLENTARRRPSIAYALTKMAIVLFTMELHRRYGAEGLSAATFTPVMSTPTSARHLGLASSSSCSGTRQQCYSPATTAEGAQQLVWLASSTPGVEWTSGEYYAKRRIAKANRAAYDPGLAGELWDRTLARVT